MNCFSSQGEKSEKYLLGIVSMELRFIVNWYKYKKINEGLSFVKWIKRIDYTYMF